MKTQTFGTSKHRVKYSARLAREVSPVESGGAEVALNNYRDNRENGKDEDGPTRPFPNDGQYEWESEYAEKSKAIYTEGLEDKIWMAEKDRNYIFRLERENLLDALEPNLKTENPNLYIKIKSIIEL